MSLQPLAAILKQFSNFLILEKNKVLFRSVLLNSHLMKLHMMP